jgi:ABC-type transport system involved in Fe-S cluster assembly fused permease/ATPase subunit
VVSNGGVVETGDHQTMIQARGPYAQLYLLQTLDQDQSGG